MLKEISLSASKTLSVPQDRKIYVSRNRGNDELAPSGELLKEFKELNAAYGDTPEAHNRAYREVRYEQRFREQILHSSAAMKRLEQLSKESTDRDIYFICYEGPAKACHRRILLRICAERFGAKVQVEGVEP